MFLMGRYCQKKRFFCECMMTQLDPPLNLSLSFFSPKLFFLEKDNFPYNTLKRVQVKPTEQEWSIPPLLLVTDGHLVKK